MTKIYTTYLAFFLLTFTCWSGLQAQWVHSSELSTQTVVSFNAIGGNLFAGTQDSGLYLSNDNGLTWTPKDSGLNGNQISTLLADGTELIAGTNMGAFRSTNGGTSWFNTALRNFGVTSLALGPSNSGGKILFAGTGGFGVESSPDSGGFWTTANTGLPQNSEVAALAYCGYNLVAGMTNGGVYVSANSGMNWSTTNITNLPVFAFAVGGANFLGYDIFVATSSGGVYYSPDNGSDWSAVDSGLTGLNIISLAAGPASGGGTVLFAGTDAGQIYLTTNNGTSWSESDSGLSATTVATLFVNGQYVYAGTDSGVWRRPISQVTSVRKTSKPIPRAFALQQNYPNPFNPVTIINYELPKAAFVHVSVYNIIGQEIRTVVNQYQQPGQKSVRFDGSSLPSGIYFYKITAGSFTSVKKMMLIK
jgi:photosystem II stability/assembly factor-like uncharacterized protein